MMMRWLLIFAVALLLAGCKGGGGGNSSSGPSAPMPPVPRTEPLLYLYFGVKDKQIEETADHVNAVWTPDWGDWETPGGRQAIADYIVAMLTEAKARGIHKALVTVGFLIFGNSRGTPAYLNTTALIAFRERLASLGLADMVCGLYPIDEPDMRGVPDDIMRTVFRDVKAAWPGAKVWVIYGDHGTPGISEADVIGTDDYPKAEGVLQKLPPLKGGQRWVLVPGGSDPWRNDPAPFATFAVTRNEVAAIAPFVWFDRTDEQGIERKGIRSNGMADAYRKAVASVAGVKVM